MPKYTVTSWKQMNPITQLNNSVDKATHAVEQTASHPNHRMIQQSKNAMDRAENAVNNALISEENQEPIQRNIEQLDQNREQIQQLEDRE